MPLCQELTEQEREEAYAEKIAEHGDGADGTQPRAGNWLRRLRPVSHYLDASMSPNPTMRAVVDFSCACPSA